MPDIHTTISRSKLRDFLTSMPGIISGRVADRYNIASGFQARVAWGFLGEVKTNFQLLGRGGTNEAGDHWKPLSAEYLAYQRPIRGTGRPKAGKKWPGGKDGLMTAAELKQWRRNFAQAMAYLVKSHSVDDAKRIAAAIATKKYKDAGGKVKISDPRFGGRQVGVDYQTGVDRGILRNSLVPGSLVESGESASYSPTENQVYRTKPGEVIVGSNVPYAAAFHKRRRIWPENLPASWAGRLRDVGNSGIKRILSLLKGGQL